MVLMIKNARADRVVRELASRTGETIADAVTIAAEERLARLPKTTGRIDREELERVLARIRSYPTANEHLTDDEIIGYDENGLPS
jgi:antitoxin VapB